MRPIGELHDALAMFVPVMHHRGAKASPFANRIIADSIDLDCDLRDDFAIVARLGILTAKLPPTQFQFGDLARVEPFAGLTLNKRVIFFEKRKCSLSVEPAMCRLKGRCRFGGEIGEVRAVPGREMILFAVQGIKRQNRPRY